MTIHTGNRFGLDSNMVFMSVGDEWRMHRRICQQHFRLDAMAAQHPIQTRKVHVLLKRLLETPEKFDYHAAMYAFQAVMLPFGWY
jgi:cytochrome P450